MGQMGRPGLSLGQKRELWNRLSSGQSLSEIGRALGKHAGSIHGVLAAKGGIVSLVRMRAVRSLTFTERESISRGIAADLSVRAIVLSLGRAASTISREIKRNGGL